MSSSKKKNLPQEGTGGEIPNGESLPGASAPGCPSYSGGGKHGASSLVSNLLVPGEQNSCAAGTNKNSTSAAGSFAIPGNVTSVGSVGATARHVDREKGCPSGTSGRQTRRSVVDPSLPVAAGHFSRESDYESDDSLMSFMSFTSGTSVGSQRRKRALPLAAPKSSSKRSKVRSVVGPNEEETAGSDGLDLTLAQLETRSMRSLPNADDLQDDMRMQPTADLGATIVERMAIVEAVANKSRNLKGSFVRDLRLAARYVKAAAVELAQRTTSSATIETLEKENVELRSKQSNLEREMTSLKRELQALRNRDSGVAAAASSIPRPAQGTTEPLSLSQVAKLMDEKLARFATNLENRALRPPLGGKPATIVPSEATAEPRATAPEKSKKGKGKGKKSVPLPPVPLPAVPSGSSPSPVVPTTAAAAQTWAKVAGRKAKTGGPIKAQGSNKPSKPPGKLKPARLPASAAVTLTVPEGSDVTYAQVMSTAKARVKLADCGITEVRQKRAINGGLVLEVVGADSAAKADQLAKCMSSALSDLGVKVSRPVKMGELRVMGLDESISAEEVAVAVAAAGECSTDQVKVGKVRHSTRRLGTVWVRCPLAAVRKVVASPRLRIGEWISVRVEALSTRPLQCFRCLETGHVRGQCPNPEDRSTRCYACGEPGHNASTCTARILKCPLCSDLGRPSDHRLGGKKCDPPKKRKGGKRGVQDPLPLSQGARVAESAAPSQPGPSPLEAMEAQQSSIH